MAAKSKEDRGRNFYETSSPFETYGGSSKTSQAKTFRGLVDSVPMPTSDTPRADHVQPLNSMSKFHPEQYDNPRGYPGIAMVMKGDEKPKLPMQGRNEHSITHHMEGEGGLARTGKRT